MQLEVILNAALFVSRMCQQIPAFESPKVKWLTLTFQHPPRYYLKLFVVPSFKVEATVKCLLLVVLVSIYNLGCSYAEFSLVLIYLPSLEKIILADSTLTPSL